MTRIRRIVALTLSILPALLASSGCGPSSESADEDADQMLDPIQQKDLAQVFRRTVLGRVYQHGQWTLPAADRDHDGTPDLERDAQYVCETFAKLEPTYVSGLVRFDGTEPIGQKQLDAFRQIRKCIRQAVDHPVRFDVVLNATHYDSPQALVSRMKQIDALFRPDLFFFDFFQKAYREKPKVVRAGIEWAHSHGRLIGGNDWGSDAPEGADFVAVADDPGIPEMQRQIAALRQRHPGLPILMHLENNPGNPENRGEQWIFERTTDQRKALLAKLADGQKPRGYRLMYPVFFPLSAQRKGDMAEFSWYKGFVAYDARRDGNMLQRIRSLLDAHD